MTVQDIINDARAKLGDTVSPYQWLDAHFYTPINNGIRAIAARSPHCLYVSTVTTTLPADVAAVGTTVAIIPEFRNELVGLVVAQMRQEDQTQASSAQPAPDGEPTP